MTVTDLIRRTVRLKRLSFMVDVERSGNSSEGGGGVSAMTLWEVCETAVGVLRWPLEVLAPAQGWQVIRNTLSIFTYWSHSAGGEIFLDIRDGSASVTPVNRYIDIC